MDLHSLHIGRILHERKVFLAILGMGLALRLCWLWATYDEPLLGDAALYHANAVQITEGADFEHEWPPFLPWYLAAFIWLFGKSAIVARLAMLPFYILLSAGLDKLVRTVAGPKKAAVAVLAIAVWPSFVLHSVEPLSYLPAAALLTWLMLFLYRMRKGGDAAAGGVLGSLLILLRPATLLLYPLGLYRWLRTGKWGGAAIFAGIGLLLIGGTVWKVSEAEGGFVWINTFNNRNFFLGNNDYTPDYRTWKLGTAWQGEAGREEWNAYYSRFTELDPIERNRAFRAEAMDHILSHPGKFIKRSLARARVYTAFDTFTGSYARWNYGWSKWAAAFLILMDAIWYFLVAIGSIAVFFNMRSPFLRLAGITYLLCAFPYLISFSHPVYHMSILPLLLVVALHNVRPPSDVSYRRPDTRRRYAFYGTLILFFLIQLEWLIDGFEAFNNGYF